ncbi:MAG: hypothetical protein JO247_17390 [Chloroflexi bacterium]|nr:hypothetical protein [Chloroflexota bacterium]
METCSLCSAPATFVRSDLCLCEPHAREVEERLGSLSYALQLSPRALERAVELLVGIRPLPVAA